MRKKKRSSQYSKLHEKGSEHIQMITKDCDGWNKKLEDADGVDSSDSTTTDEHKKMLT